MLHRAIRENGYALGIHGSVSRDGKGNDLDLIAVPEEFCVTPSEEMDRIMCDLIGAQPVQQEPNRGLLEPGRAHAYWKTAAESISGIVSQLR